MNWLNPYGLLLMGIIMIPNILFAVKQKDSFQNFWQNKAVETIEQIGRFGCFALMVFNIPHTYKGFWFPAGKTIYLIVNGCLLIAYSVIWAIYFRRNSLFRALSLSILPSLIFLFSGVMLLSVPLLVASLIFAPSHILLSFKNVKSTSPESKMQ